jgi:hypothetical protein
MRLPLTCWQKYDLNRMKFFFAFVALVSVQCACVAADVISLSGQWLFDLDRSDVGVAERWFSHPLTHQVRLPGSLPEQGIGDDVTLQTPWTGGIIDRSFFDSPQYATDREPGNIRVPFWLQPDKYYAGAAWYQREMDIPAEWKIRRAVLFLERAHWETRVWLDGLPVGTNDSLSTPHQYDLGQLTPGKHTVSIRVDNRRIIDIGENTHGISDHTQGNWNGIVGRIELHSTPLVWIDDLQIYPHLATKSVTIKGRVGNQTGQGSSQSLRLFILDGRKTVTEKALDVQVAAAGADFETEIPLGGNVETWDEFHPHLYTAKATLDGETRAVTFGMREISTQGTQFVINGRKTFIRGTLECCIFPKTGHPPTEVGEWKRILRVARSYGLNLLRFHSYCPPEAAFIAGDELGFYFQVETCWANQSTTIGDGKPVDQWVYDETSRILQAYGNHPSFLLMPYGNEPGGKNVAPYMAKFVAHFKSLDSRRLWTSASGWPQIPENQFDVTPDPRIQAWGEGVKSRINALPPETMTDYRAYISQRPVPVVSHEIGQWCVYPNFAEIPKYTGYLKPKNFGVFADALDAHALKSLAHPFLLASGKLQTLCYKEDIESALRTPGMGGFELLDLHDFPGQGTALVGVLDPFWGDKGYVTAKEYSRFCNSTVPLARLQKRVFTIGEQLTAELEVAHFGPEALDGVEASWKLVADNHKVLCEGKLPAKHIPIGNAIQLGDIAADLKDVPAPAHCRLVVALAKFENDWDVWVYPAASDVASSPAVLVTARFDEPARARLRAGGNVLLTIPGKETANYDPDPVKPGFSSIFWNTAWTGRQAPTTLGILCDPRHPALAEFPTAFHSDWQWWYLIHRAGALRLDLLSPGLEPIVRVIDDWVTARPLGLVVEAKVGRGKMVICGFDLTRNSDDVVSRQMRRSLEDYMVSDKFAPTGEITLGQVESLIAPPAPKALRGVRRISADSEEAEYEATNAIDGDPQSFWHSSWEEGSPGFPHHLIVELGEPETLAGFTALPRQDGNHNGWIKGYRLYVSMDGQDWGSPVAKGMFSENDRLKTVKFHSPVVAKFVKLEAISGYVADGHWASLAEFHLIESTKH